MEEWGESRRRELWLEAFLGALWDCGGRQLGMFIQRKLSVELLQAVAISPCRAELLA